MQLNNVTLKRGTNIVLDSINLMIPNNSIVIIIGESGAGKTTLLRLLAQLEKPTTGAMVKENTKSVGMVFQQLHLFPHMTVIKQVMHSLVVVLKLSRHEAYSRACMLLDAVGLSTYKDRYPHELSGGQQQRVAIARALAPKPDILILDEPTSGLDSVTRDNLAFLLKQLKELENITIIISTHDINFAQELHDMICILDKGRLTCFDKKIDILNNAF